MTDQINPYASPEVMDAPSPESVLSNEYPAEMRWVRTGLSLVYYSICGILLSVVGFLLIAVLLGGVAGGALSGVVLVALGLVVLGCLVMMLVGEVFCMSIPSESGAKGLVVASVALQVASVVIGIVVGAASAFIGMRAAAGINLLTNLLGTASTVCFILFMRKVALYIQRSDLAGRAVRVLFVGGIAFALVIGSGAMMIANRAADSPATLATLVASVLAMLVAFLMYVNLVTYLRKAIAV